MRLGKISREILLGLAKGAAMFLVLSSPVGTRRVIKEIRYRLRQANLKEEYLKKKLYYLRQKKLIEFKTEGENIRIILSEDGTREVLNFNKSQMKIARPSRWDKKWRLVLFDIPENFRAGRNALRSKLDKLGFIQFNKSAWIIPYECEKEIDFVAELFGVSKYVHYMTVEKTTNDSNLRYKFEL